MTMLRVLQVEDSPDDAELEIRALAKAGFQVTAHRVETSASLSLALSEPWDVILCDYTMPELDAPAALSLVKAQAADTPVVVVSGTIGEETAVETMRLGASDYLLKDNLGRLGVAVQHAIEEAARRKERRVAEAAIRELESSFRRIIEKSPELIIVHREGSILYVNQQAAERLHANVDDLVGSPLSQITSFRERNEERWTGTNGTSIPVEVVNVDVTFEGKPAVVAIGRDLTERNRMATAMVETDRLAAVGLLCAAVGHEINNPLAYVLANLEYITTEIDCLVSELSPESLRKFDGRIPDLRLALSDTVHGARRVRDIVQDLRTFSRNAADHEGVVDVRTVLESSLRMARVQISQRAKVTTNFGEVPLVKGDESRIGQVFLNLLINAAQALPEGRPNRIDVSTCFEDGWVVVEIADSGPGIPKDILPRIFEPFFTTKAKSGTGLGLPISDRIVRELGGQIRVDSNETGSRFRVCFPATGS